MTASLQKFPPLTPQAVVPLVFDFSGFLGSANIQSVVSVEIWALRGVDTSPNTRLYNAPIMTAKNVIQWIRYPVIGEKYKIMSHIKASDNREWSIYATFDVQEV